MALTYDYDIRWVLPGDEFDSSVNQPGLKHMGGAQPASREYIALFRDPATAQALSDADPEVRAYFKASGFGLDSYDSGAPAGYFPTEDLAARNDVTERLTHNLAKFDLKGKDTNGIHFADFLAFEMSAQPIDITSLTKRAKVQPKPKAKASDDEDWCRWSPSINPLVLGFVVLVIFLMPYVTEGVARL